MAHAGAVRSSSPASAPAPPGTASVGSDGVSGAVSVRRGGRRIDTSTGASASPAAPVDGGAGSGVGRRIG